MMMAAGVSGAWGQDVTRTWDFTNSSVWKTIDASTGTVYYATDGTTKTSTEFNASTAVCMQVTNAFDYSTDHYQFGGNSTSDTNPDKDYMSIVVPAGYTLTVNGADGGGTNYSNCVKIKVGSDVKVANPTGTYTDLVYGNNTESAVTAYIYTPSTLSSRVLCLKSITLSSGTKTITPITGNTSWDFTNRVYTATFDGVTMENIYYGSGVKQVSGQIDFGGTGKTSTGANTLQIKIPANQAVGLLVFMTGSNNRSGKVHDGTSELASITDGSKATTVSIAASASERTLYFYNSNYGNGYTWIKYIYAYTKQTVNIGSTGWATLYTPCALDFSGVSGLTAYTATCTGSTVTLTQVSNVPAGTGVVLKGTPNTPYDIPVTGSSSTAKGHLTGEFLTETAYNAFDSEYTIYVLTSVNSGANVQFNPVTSGNIAAGKAFLKISDGASSLARSLNVVFADETTGIAEMRNQTEEQRNDVYNLRGQRVVAPQKGIYIVNGRKVMAR